MRWDRVFFAFAERFGWTPEQTASLPIQQVTILLNCMIEESDEIRDIREGNESKKETMEFKPKNPGALDLSTMPIDQLHQTLQQNFGTSQGGDLSI